MNQIITNVEAAEPARVAPYQVGNFQAGESRGELSKQWIARPHDQRFLSLSELRASVHARAERSTERRSPTKGVEIIAPEPKSKDDLHKLTIGFSTDGVEVAPTYWAFGQLAQLAGAPAAYLRKLPSPLVADAMNYGLRYLRTTDQIKGYHTADELLAATGPEYGRIFDRDVVDAVMNVAGNGVGDSRWKIPGALDWRTMRYDPEHPVSKDTTTLYASDRDVFMFLVDDRNPIEVGKLPSGEPDLMFRGFYVTNSEVGSGALKIACFYLRAVCCNRIMWGVEGFEEISMRHSKNAPDRFIEECRPALESYANGSTAKLIEGVEKAKAAKIASDDDAMLDFLIERKLSRAKALEVMETVEREEGRKARTVWDVAQGITAVARSIPNTNDRVELELVARRALDRAAA